VCALRDLGTPGTGKNRRTEDPTGFQESGNFSEGVLGNLYTTSPYGGKNGLGTILRLSQQGEPKVFYDFDGGVNGKVPVGGLTFGEDGYFYGTTSEGGKFDVGTIFRVNAAGGAPETLYHFRNGRTAGLKRPCESGRCPFSPEQRMDAGGAYPLSAPVRDRQGNFYGVTSYAFNQQYGVLYRIAPPYDSSHFKTLCVFNPNLAFREKALARFICAPKGTSGGSLIVGDGGTTLYGTTVRGHGTLFKATLGGKVTTLHEFDPASGSRPSAVMQASDGSLYGSAFTLHARGAGVIYRVDPATSAYTVLSSFVVGTTVVGAHSLGALVEGKDPASGRLDGYLYGATRDGGRKGGGTLFRIKLNGGSLTVLHDFSMYETGRSPVTAPFQHTDGSFYGLTSLGGLYGGGVFYRLSQVDLSPVVPAPPRFKGGKPATDEKGVPLKDPLVTVRTNVMAVPPSGVRKTEWSDGITVTVNCRNPHFVQFFSREKISAQGEWLSGTAASSSGTYPLTTQPAKPEWHSDATGKPNAYFDQGPGAVWTAPYTVREKSILTIFDQPGFKAPLFDPADQANPNASQTWRGSARVFAICNCQVVREIHWTLEKIAGKQAYKWIWIRPADNTMLEWINARLVKDGFRPVP
jgi:uncharacterized repeat protein (TIGR03803 family)